MHLACRLHRACSLAVMGKRVSVKTAPSGGARERSKTVAVAITDVLESTAVSPGPPRVWGPRRVGPRKAEFGKRRAADAFGCRILNLVRWAELADALVGLRSQVMTIAMQHSDCNQEAGLRAPPRICATLSPPYVNNPGLSLPAEREQETRAGVPNAQWRDGCVRRPNRWQIGPIWNGRSDAISSIGKRWDEHGG
jgi:hypothetical protein